MFECKNLCYMLNTNLNIIKNYKLGIYTNKFSILKTRL